MENHRVGETGLSESGPSSQLPLGYGVHGITPAASNFLYCSNFFMNTPFLLFLLLLLLLLLLLIQAPTSDQEGAAYFGELEAALMHGVAGIRSDEDRKPFFTSRPPTLEIFPSWPMRSQQTHEGNSQPAESTDSGSAQNTITQLDSECIKASSEQSSEQQQGMIASDVPRTAADAAPPNHQPRTQEKRRMAGSTADKDGKILDAKTLRRLAQNREAARKSRLRKKAYVQQLESSRIKLTQLEQDLERARSQGLFFGGASAGGNISSAATIFDMEYARWLDENYKHMTDLRGGLQAHLPEGDLRVIVDECLAHYDEMFRVKGIAAKSDVFHLISGMWTTPAERCFLWMGGFRPSELLKQILIPQLDPLTEQQLVGICNLQQSSQQAEEALSQGLEQLHQSLSDTVASGSLCESTNVGSYMDRMGVALGKLANLEGFVRQADNLRQETLHQLRRILTVRQAARCFFAFGEYHSRLRALSSLWTSRPRENLITDGSAFPATNELQIIHQPVHSHFSAF